MSEAAIPLQIVVSAQPLGIRITVRFPSDRVADAPGRGL